MNNMLTLEEVKHYLEVEEKEIEKYISLGKLHAYKIGGTYLRFRKEEVQSLRFQVMPADKVKGRAPSVFARVHDFWHFNNFYIISLVFVVLVFFFLMRG